LIRRPEVRIGRVEDLHLKKEIRVNVKYMLLTYCI
jgi:hypothetical protein